MVAITKIEQAEISRNKIDTVEKEQGKGMLEEKGITGEHDMFLRLSCIQYICF